VRAALSVAREVETHRHGGLPNANVDKVFAKAVKAGAEVVMPVRDMFWGDRFGSVRGPQGNTWAIATHREDVPPKEMKKRAAAAFAP
jgi:PhnB protein